jgi:hypothetical protein
MSSAPRDKQDRPDPPTYKEAKKWDAKTVARFYQAKLKKQPRSRMSKADMLSELFPEEAPAVDVDVEEVEEAPRRKRTRDKVQDLATLRETVRVFYLESPPP